MSAPEHVVVVGGGAAGLTTVESLRRCGLTGTLTLISEEAYLPYDRPPLSKQILTGAWEPDRATLRSLEDLQELDVDLILGDAATSLDLASRTVHTRSGRAVTGDAIVIATGVRARELPSVPALEGIHILRSLDDALRLRAALAGAERVVVVGDGVLGAEIAASASTLGLTVDLVGPQPVMMALQLGPLVGAAIAGMHSEHGVRLHPGTSVAEWHDSDGLISGVRLDDDTELAADAVVVAVGSALNTEWLASSGLSLDPLDGSIICAPDCQAAEGVYAVGDVARWQHPGLDRSVRLENRTNATEQAMLLAQNIMSGDDGDRREYAPVPYFWTEQFDARIQVYGFPDPTADVEVVEGDLASRRFVVRYSEGDRVTAVVGWNMPKPTRQHRKQISLDQDRQLATSQPNQKGS